MVNHRTRKKDKTRCLCLTLGLALLFGCTERSLTEREGENGVVRSKLQEEELSAKPSYGQSANVVWVVMKEKANLQNVKTVKGWVPRGELVYDTLKQVADSSQASIRTFLAQRKVKTRSFWIVNALRVEADADTVDEISKRPDVAKVLPDPIYSIPPIEKGTSKSLIDAIEWNLESIRVPEVWNEFGVKGSGIVVANIDTGVQYEHPALLNQYRGTLDDDAIDHNYNWFDPTDMCGDPEDGPCDDVGHGTHTMGTMVGDDGNPGENQIGVAPHAKWIAAKGCETFGCPAASLLASAEWILAPTDLNDDNPRPDLRPQVVNNSWGGSGGDPFFQEVVDAWVAAGIFPAFSAGNYVPPMCGDVGSPGDYSASYAAGAYDEMNAIASFSARGPSVYDVIKPNIAAPGVEVRSSVPYDDYDWYSGTSMASPHVAGTVALLWEAAPSIFGDIEATRDLLDTSAVDTEDLSCGGTVENNNVWGEGRLDAFAAVEAAPRGPTGYLIGTTSDAEGAPLVGVQIVASSPELSKRSAKSDESGRYSLRLPIGEYEVGANLFGYLSETVTGISIVEDENTIQDFSLTQAPSYTASGYVTDTEGAPLGGVNITIESTPLPPAITDETGYYEFEGVPVGEYDIVATAGRCYEKQTLPLVIDGDVSVDFELSVRVDSYGYRCSVVPFEYVEADDVIISNGDEESIPVSLPFEAIFYGQSYDTVYVNVNGFVNFGSSINMPTWTNTSIPNPEAPNNAIYALWDDLFFFSEFGTGSILTTSFGEEPNRVFVIEWRDAGFYEDWESPPAHFEMLLHEKGEITFQYITGETQSQRGGRATIGIENEDGTDGFQYSYNQESVDSETAIRFTLPPSGFVQGYVTDANDGLPIKNAVVRALDGENQIRKVKTNDKGRYRMQVPVGSYNIEASQKNYTSESAVLSVGLDEVIVQDFELETATVSVTPNALQLLLMQGEQRSREITIANTGTLPLEWEINEAGGRRRNLISTASLERNPDYNPNAYDTREIYTTRPDGGGWSVDTPGDVLDSFVPQGLSLAWGVGFTGNIWLSDVINVNNVEFSTEGDPTGEQWPAFWASGWPADMAYDATRGLVCQVAVGGNNGIHCWDPSTGDVSFTITGSPWTNTSQRGLAYRDDDDSFYIGGWNEGIIYHIAGQSHEEPGTVLDQCRPADGDISGLAWNGSSGVLWVATNSPTDTIYELSEDCTVLATFAHPTPGFNGAGIEMDDEGNLWTIGQSPNMAYLIESGVPSFSEVPWMTPDPETGIIQPGASETMTVTIDTTDLESGVYLASLIIRSNAGRKSNLRIPVSLVVTEYRQGVDAGGSEYTDDLDDLWSADQAYEAGGWGYVQRSRTSQTRRDISGTDDPVLYQSQRIAPYGYRFDDVPNGVYQVELRFAELNRRQRIGSRLFDVVIENDLVLPAHDIVYEVGTFAADDYVFFIDVEDNQMDVRFIEREGYRQPVINALRVTHRPDR